MEGLVTGDVVVIPFPFSDLSEAKRRPALVVACLPGDDIIVCQITTRGTKDDYAVPLGPEDFVSGSIKAASSIRPNRLFTADSGIVEYRAGVVRREKVRAVVDTIIELIKQ